MGYTRRGLLSGHNEKYATKQVTATFRVDRLRDGQSHRDIKEVAPRSLHAAVAFPRGVMQQDVFVPSHTNTGIRLLGRSISMNRTTQRTHQPCTHRVYDRIGRQLPQTPVWYWHFTHVSIRGCSTHTINRRGTSDLSSASYVQKQHEQISILSKKDQ